MVQYKTVSDMKWGKKHI